MGSAVALPAGFLRLVVGVVHTLKSPAAPNLSLLCDLLLAHDQPWRVTKDKRFHTLLRHESWHWVSV